MQYLTLEYAKQQLARAESVLDASLDAGLSGPGRLHDLFVTFDAISPGEFKQMGSGLIIEYGFHTSPFGLCLVAITQRGICHFGFIDSGERGQTIGRLQENWPGARLVENFQKTRPMVDRIFNSGDTRESRSFHLLVKGTNFQVNVWKALLHIPRGCLVSYQDIAGHMGRPRSFRAVANTVAINPVGYLIPCHRVILKSGEIHNYRWGTARKKAILGWEAAADESRSESL